MGSKIIKLFFMCIGFFIHCLGSDNATNLIIINDFSEKFEDEKAELQAMTVRLDQSLQENQLIMCSKYVVHTFQKIVNYVQTHLEAEFKDLKKIYDQFSKGQINKEQALELINQQPISIQKKCLFNIFMTHKNMIDSEQYIIKKITDDYVIFIPKSKYDEKNLDNQLGLNVSSLSNYDFNFIPSTSLLEWEKDYKLGKPSIISNEDYSWLIESSQSYNRGDYAFYYRDTGKILQQALKVVAPTSELLNMSKLAPLNVLLAGHGTKDEYISEISILKRPNELNSDFQKILNDLQNNFLVKSLTISSCYPGGSKNIKTFNIVNQFNNQNMEKISYPIIMQGSFELITYGYPSLLPFEDTHDYIKKYFNALNELPPDYSTAAKLSSKYLENNNLNRYANLVSIKMPHTSWFSPEIFDKSMQKITQIQSSTKKEFIINPDIKIILISANVIDSLKIVSSELMPKLFPMNYINQNYVIKSLNFNQQSSFSFQEAINYLSMSILPLSNVHESIRILIKELNAEGKFLYKDLYFFAHVNIKGSYQSGYMYTDIYGNTFINLWPFEQNSNPSYTSFEKQCTNDEKMFYEQAIGVKEIEHQSLLSIKNTEELEKNIAERNKPDFQIPEKVAKSRKMTEKKSDDEWVKDSVTKKWKIKDKFVHESPKLPLVRPKSLTMKEEHQHENYQKELTNSPGEVDFVHA